MTLFYQLTYLFIYKILILKYFHVELSIWLQTEPHAGIGIDKHIDVEIRDNDDKSEEGRLASGCIVRHQEGRKTRGRGEAGRYCQGRFRRRSDYTLAGTIKEDQQQA